MNTQEIIIRQYKTEDYNKVISFWDKSGLPVRPNGRDSYQKIKAQVENGITIFLVAELNGEVIGTILGTHDGRKAWINRLAIDAEFRRKKIAQRLAHEVEKWFEENELDVFACVIEGDNTASMEFFKKIGYSEWDVRYFSKRRSNES